MLFSESWPNSAILVLCKILWLPNRSQLLLVWTGAISAASVIEGFDVIRPFTLRMHYFGPFHTTKCAYIAAAAAAAAAVCAATVS